MPTIMAIALESLLEPNTRDSSPPPPPPPNPQQHCAASAAARKPPSQPYYISPALFAAPDHASIPDSSPTSPYVVNHKRRDLRPTATLNGLKIQKETLSGRPDEGTVLVEEGGGAGRGEEEEKALDAEWSGDIEDDDFFDPRQSMSAKSSSEAEDGGSLRRPPSRCRTPLTNQSEFFDADEDFFSDGSVSHSPSFSTNNEIDLHALRLNLLEEIDMRKRAEETLLHMQNQWQRMAKSLCQVGLSFPEIQNSGNVQIQTDPVALCQEIVVTRFVSEAVERGIVRAETEAAVEEVIELKNHEISRLRDRLQYYEAMNHEMSQRNQEVVESARQQRLRRKTRQRWIWSCIVLSITVGASLLAYSYLPHSGKEPKPTSCPECEACLPE